MVDIEIFKFPTILIIHQMNSEQPTLDRTRIK